MILLNLLIPSPPSTAPINLRQNQNPFTTVSYNNLLIWKLYYDTRSWKNANWKIWQLKLNQYHLYSRYKPKNAIACPILTSSTLLAYITLRDLQALLEDLLSVNLRSNPRIENRTIKTKVACFRDENFLSDLDKEHPLQLPCTCNWHLRTHAISLPKKQLLYLSSQ